MSGLLPLLTSDPWELQLQRYRRTNCEWDHFGMGVTPDEIKMLKTYPKLYNALRNDPDASNYYIPLIGKNGYQVSMDVRQFRPNEVTVKTIENEVIVECKHDDRVDVYGTVSRQFIRKYPIPIGFEIKEVISALSSDGILTITVPPSKSFEGTERVVPIQQTGPAHINVKDNVDVEDESNKSSDTEKNNSTK